MAFLLPTFAAIAHPLAIYNDDGAFKMRIM
jgi:hypothetical protein